MNAYNLFRDSGSYLALNLDPRDENPNQCGRQAPAITIARQTGARGITICTRLHCKLQEKDAKDPLRWTLFDSELSKEILKQHNLPEHLEKFIPEDAVSEFQATVNEMLGRHPSLWTLFEDTKETVAHLANIGHCILVGRGGNHIAGHLHNVLNVRLIGSTNKRLKYVTNNLQISESEAAALIKRDDHARRAYVKQHFHCDIDDPFNYDLVINTDRLSDEAVVDQIITALGQLNASPAVV